MSHGTVQKMTDSELDQYKEKNPALFNYVTKISDDVHDQISGPMTEAVELAKKAVLIDNRFILNNTLTLKYPFDTMTFMKLWDYFRMNDLFCLSKFPSLDHIRERYATNPMQIDQDWYKVASLFFRHFITSPHKHKMMQIISNNPHQANILIVYDEKLNPIPFAVGLLRNDPASIFDDLIEDNKNSNILQVTVLNLDGPFDEDPDQNPYQDLSDSEEDPN
jgi:hypothetical protein